MRFDDFLTFLRKSYGRADLAVDEDGRCSLLFAGNIDVAIFARGRTQLFFEAVLDQLPSDEFEREARLRVLMTFSSAIARDRSEILAMGADKGRPVVFRRLPLDELTPDAAFEELDAFVGEIELWLDRDEPAPAPLSMTAPHIIMP